MLVSVREGVKDGKFVESGSRLHFLDECPYRLWDSSDHWSAFYVELAGLREDRELTNCPCTCWPRVRRRRCRARNEVGKTASPASSGQLSLGRRVLEGPGFPAQGVDVFYAPSELELSRCQGHGVTSS